MKNLAALVSSCVVALMAACAAPAPAGPTCTVEGCVQRAGPIELSGDMTAFEVLSLAGPIEGRSDLSRVQIVRHGPDGELRMSLNLEPMAMSGDSTFNVLVVPGDVMTVPEL
jgi:protein involved in polysaccharide export with SLBB domain